MNSLIYLAAALAIFATGFGSGFHVGANEQKVSDQEQFNAVAQKLADQKTEANARYRKDQNANLALAAERDQLKTTLEKEHEANRLATAALRDKFSTASLRFSAAHDAGSGNRCRCTGEASTDPADTVGTTIVQLPGKITGDLRRLAFDADELADSYRECYGYANQIK